MDLPESILESLRAQSSDRSLSIPQTNKHPQSLYLDTQGKHVVAGRRWGMSCRHAPTRRAKSIPAGYIGHFFCDAAGIAEELN